MSHRAIRLFILVISQFCFVLPVLISPRHFCLRRGRNAQKNEDLFYARGRKVSIGTVLCHIEMDTEVMDVLTTAILLLRSSLFLSLHLTGNIGSFPKPLSAEEEKEYLAKYAQGDMEARNILIERNLRLVAHIIKNG